jgi:hypothetical protein
MNYETLENEIRQLKLLLKEQKQLGAKSTVNVNSLHNIIANLKALLENL